MDEKVNVEGEASPVGATGQPDQATSQGKGTPTSADEIAELKTAFKQFVAEVRQAQGVKDRSIDEVRKEVTSKTKDFESQLAELKKLTSEGMSERQALLSMKLDEALTRFGVDQSAVAQPVSGNTAQLPVEETVSDFLREVKLDPNSPEITAELRKGGTPVEQIKRLAKVAINLGTARQPEPNPAAVMSTGGGQAVPPEDDLESIDRELARLKEKPKYQMDMKRYNELYEKRQKLFQPK